MEPGSDTGIHPKRILYFLFALLAFLLLPMLLIPEPGWKITDTFTLKFLTWNDLLHKKRVEQKDITHLVNAVEVDTSTTDEHEAGAGATATPVYAAPTHDTTTSFPIQVGGNLHPLDLFFHALDSCTASGQPIAIGYYGDSQVEGDRFSDYLRNKLQKEFGGGGPGMVTPMDISNMRITVRQEWSNEWIKLACYGYSVAKIEGGRFGLSGALFRYRNGYYQTKTVLRMRKDSSGTDTVQQKYWVSSNSSPWLSFRRSTQSYASVRRYTQASLWYSSRHNVTVRTQVNGVSTSETLPAGELQVRTWTLPDSAQQVRFTFPDSIGPDVIGVALDQPTGVHVDNYSMRGSSGTDFTRLNGAFLAQQHRLRGTRLLILQYGVNVVPYVKDTTAVQYYESTFLKQLQLLRRQLPEVAILVVGTTDIATKEGTDYATYPYLEAIRDAQRRAAFRAGCAFWDAYAAMGGRNSMASWVFHNPPLAAKDFTHLSPRGANILAELLHQALMREYVTFHQHKQPIN